MSFLADRSLAEVLASLAINTVIIIISVGVLLWCLILVGHFFQGASRGLEKANKRGDSGPAVFWCIVFFLIYWFWFR